MNPAALPYDTLYDIAREGPPNIAWIAFSAVVLCVVVPLAWRRRTRGQGWGLAGFVALGFGLMLGVAGLSVWDHHRLQAALSEGRAQVVEGPLQSYGVQPRARWNPNSKRYDRSIAESFYVGPVPFGFVRDASAAGYTNSGSPPLAFQPGEMLRLHYVEDAPDDFASRRIVRVERLSQERLRLGLATPTDREGP